MYHNFLIYSFADGHLGCFHVLVTVDCAAVNIGVHVSLSVLVSSGCMPSSGIVEKNRFLDSVGEGERRVI